MIWQLLKNDVGAINTIIKVYVMIYKHGWVSAFLVLPPIIFMYYFIWIYFLVVVFYIVFFLIKLVVFNFFIVGSATGSHIEIHKPFLKNLNSGLINILIFFVHYLPYSYSYFLVKNFYEGNFFNFKFFTVLFYNCIFVYFFKAPRFFMYVVKEFLVSAHMVLCLHYPIRSVCSRYMIYKHFENF